MEAWGVEFAVVEKGGDEGGEERAHVGLDEAIGVRFKADDDWLLDAVGRVGSFHVESVGTQIVQTFCHKYNVVARPLSARPLYVVLPQSFL